MSLLKTLAKAAVGMAIAKKVSQVIGGSKGRTQAQVPQGGGLSDILGQLTKGQQQAGSTGGLGGILGQVLGGGAATQSSSGGLGDILGQLTKKQGGSAGGLQDILGQITGGRAASSNSTSGGNGGILGQIIGGGQQVPAQPAQSANPLEGILGGILGKTMTGGSTAGGTAGGLGGLLDALTKQAGGAAGASGAGGLGDLLNQAMSRFGEPETQPTPEQDAAAGLLLSAMIQAAKADGAIDEAEKEALFKNLGDDITQDEIDFLNQQMVKPVDPEGLAASIPAGLRQQAYTMSLLTIDLDNQNEANYLHRFATALGLDQNTVNALHQQMGEPMLYA